MLLRVSCKTPKTYISNSHPPQPPLLPLPLTRTPSPSARTRNLGPSLFPVAPPSLISPVIVKRIPLSTALSLSFPMTRITMIRMARPPLLLACLHTLSLSMAMATLAQVTPPPLPLLSPAWTLHTSLRLPPHLFCTPALPATQSMLIAQPSLPPACNAIAFSLHTAPSAAPSRAFQAPSSMTSTSVSCPSSTPTMPPPYRLSQRHSSELTPFPALASPPTSLTPLLSSTTQTP